MRHELSFARFFEPKQHSPSVDETLRECLSRRATLEVRLGPSSVEVWVDESADDEPMLLTGQWRSPLLEIPASHTGALVLAPLVFRVEQMRLPHGCLLTMGRADRSVADFCMRNVFYAACRGDSIGFRVAAQQPTTDDRVRASRDLARTYLRIARGFLNDPILDRANAPELGLACAHVALLEFDSPVMESGAREFRAVSSRLESTHRLLEQQRTFRRVREGVLALYRP